MSARLLLWLAVLVVGASVLAELLLQPPDGGERLHLIVILAAPAVVAGGRHRRFAPS